jgi:hypothetical protein
VHRFVGEFWDYLIHRCEDYGIYWGYGLSRKIKDSKDNDIPFPEAVLMNLASAPFLPWLMNDGQLVSDPMKTWFTSADELERRLTLALL